jgi:hypothetical protein
MDNTNTTQNNNTMPTQEADTQTQGGGFGPIIGILIVVALIVFGGFYFWGHKMMEGDYMMDSDDRMMLDDIDILIEDRGTITPEEFDALLQEQATGANTGQNLDNALDDLGDLDALDAELDAIGTEL